MTSYEKVARGFKILAFLALFLSLLIFFTGKMASKSTTILLSGFMVAIIFFPLSRAIRNHSSIGRILGIMFGILMLTGFPIGTIIGIWIIWQLAKNWNK